MELDLPAHPLLRVTVKKPDRGAWCQSLSGDSVGHIVPEDAGDLARRVPDLQSQYLPLGPVGALKLSNIADHYYLSSDCRVVQPRVNARYPLVCKSNRREGRDGELLSYEAYCSFI